MATYQSAQLARRAAVPAFGAGGGQVRSQYFSVSIPAGATTADIFQLGYLPQNAVVVDATLKIADIDTGTTITLNVGDTGNAANAADPDRYFSADTTGRTGGVARMTAATGFNFATGGVPLLITAQLAAGPSTTTGTLEVRIYFTVEEPQVP